jgi:Tfp pilus assembly protein PilO
MISGAHGSRLLVGGGAVAAIFIAALSWLMVISPMRSGAQTLRENAAAVDTQNQAIAAETATLRQQVADRDQLVASARAALGALPPGAQLPGFNRQLAHQARADGVDLTSIAIGASTSSGATGAAAPGGTLTIPVTIQTTGPITQQLLFLHDLQQVGPRRALVTSTSVAPGQEGSSVETSSTLTVQLSVFAAPLGTDVRAQLAHVLRAGRSS